QPAHRCRCARRERPVRHPRPDRAARGDARRPRLHPRRHRGIRPLAAPRARRGVPLDARGGRRGGPRPPRRRRCAPRPGGPGQGRARRARRHRGRCGGPRGHRPQQGRPRRPRHRRRPAHPLPRRRRRLGTDRGRDRGAARAHRRAAPTPHGAGRCPRALLPRRPRLPGARHRGGARRGAHRRRDAAHRARRREPRGGPRRRPAGVTGTAELLHAAVERLGGKERSGQLEMAEEVARTLREPRALLVQAGTGTGKSLGYLVPVLAHAVQRHERAVVSTATLALQRQVLTHDVPLVADVVAESGAPRPQVALLKGWHNYLCKHKVAGGYPAEDEPGLFAVDAATGDVGAAPARGAMAEQVLRLREWAEETSSGDRDDLDFAVGDRAWRQVSVTKLECLGASCPMLEERFPEAARRAAHEADVVVTNHAMLGIAASGSPRVRPGHEVLVVGAAHELGERVTAQSTLELSAAVVDRTVRLARKHTGVTVEALDAAGRALGAWLETAPAGRLRRVPAELADAVTLLEAGSREALSAMKGDSEAEPGGRLMARSAMLVLHEIAERLLGDGVAQRKDVLWCDRGRTGFESARLHLAPLDVARPIATELLAGRAAVLTSATLALGGSFDPVARTLGVSLLDHL